jgi:hypothetical protein
MSVSSRVAASPCDPNEISVVGNRVSAAVEGHTTGEEWFVVVQVEGEPPTDVAARLGEVARLIPHVASVTTDYAAASALTWDLNSQNDGRRYCLSGPHPSHADPTGLALGRQAMFIECWNPDGTPTHLAAHAGYLDEVATVEIRITKHDGTEQKHTVAGPVSAVFLTLAAADRFFFPAISAQYGAGVANALRGATIRSVAGGSGPADPGRHAPGH